MSGKLGLRSGPRVLAEGILKPTTARSVLQSFPKHFSEISACSLTSTNLSTATDGLHCAHVVNNSNKATVSCSVSSQSQQYWLRLMIQLPGTGFRSTDLVLSTIQRDPFGQISKSKDHCSGESVKANSGRRRINETILLNSDPAAS